MFDCVLPTRNARNGQAILRTGRVVIKQARFKTDLSPLDPECKCPTCSEGFSRSYLRHLYLAKEILVLRLFSQHNLHVYGQLVREARAAISSGSYDGFAARWQDAGAWRRLILWVSDLPLRCLEDSTRSEETKTSAPTRRLAGKRFLARPISDATGGSGADRFDLFGAPGLDSDDKEQSGSGSFRRLQRYVRGNCFV